MMQETNKKHNKQEERAEMNSEASAIVEIEHAWKHIMNSASKKSDALQQLNKEIWEMNIESK